MSLDKIDISSKYYSDYTKFTATYLKLYKDYSLNQTDNPLDYYFIEINKGSYPDFSNEHEKPKKINFLNLPESIEPKKIIKRIIINIDPKYYNTHTLKYIDTQGYNCYVLYYNQKISEKTLELFYHWLFISNTKRNYIMYYNFTGEHICDNNIYELQQRYKDFFNIYKSNCLAEVNDGIYNQYVYYNLSKNNFTIDTQPYIYSIINLNNKDLMKGLIQQLIINFASYYFQPAMEIMKWISHTNYYDLNLKILKLRTHGSLFSSRIDTIIDNLDNIDIDIDINIDIFIENIKYVIQDSYNKILGLVYLYLNHFEPEVELELKDIPQLNTRLEYYTLYKSNSNIILNTIK